MADNILAIVKTDYDWRLALSQQSIIIRSSVRVFALPLQPKRNSHNLNSSIMVGYIIAQVFVFSFVFSTYTKTRHSRSTHKYIIDNDTVKPEN